MSLKASQYGSNLLRNFIWGTLAALVIPVGYHLIVHHSNPERVRVYITPQSTPQTQITSPYSTADQTKLLEDVKMMMASNSVQFKDLKYGTSAMNGVAVCGQIKVMEAGYQGFYAAYDKWGKVFAFLEFEQGASGIEYQVTAKDLGCISHISPRVYLPWGYR